MKRIEGRSHNERRQHRLCARPGSLRPAYRAAALAYRSMRQQGYMDLEAHRAAREAVSEVRPDLTVEDAGWWLAPQSSSRPRITASGSGEASRLESDERCLKPHPPSHSGPALDEQIKKFSVAVGETGAGER